jgi:hypothetical protein
MSKSALAIIIITGITFSTASAQTTIVPPDPQKIDAMTKSCVYNSAFYSQGAFICVGARGLQCGNGNWVDAQDPSTCKGQPLVPPAR